MTKRIARTLPHPSGFHPESAFHDAKADILAFLRRHVRALFGIMMLRLASNPRPSAFANRHFDPGKANLSAILNFLNLFPMGASR